MVRKILVYWRDIPSQVIVQRGRVREKLMLEKRFQEAIDRAAMRAGKGSSDAYIAEWRRESERIDSDAELSRIAAEEAERLESSISDEQLAAMIRNNGAAVSS